MYPMTWALRGLLNMLFLEIWSQIRQNRGLYTKYTDISTYLRLHLTALVMRQND